MISNTKILYRRALVELDDFDTNNKTNRHIFMRFSVVVSRLRYCRRHDTLLTPTVYRQRCEE